MSLKKQTKKVAVGIVGGFVLLAGIIMIPYPGPGWLVVFAGLGILSTEFEWAQHVLNYAKKKYDDWSEWVKRQNFVVKSFIWLVTALIVIITIWLLNGYGIVNNVLNLNLDWLNSPLSIFN